jgi:hypothetical protein
MLKPEEKSANNRIMTFCRVLVPAHISASSKRTEKGLWSRGCLCNSLFGSVCAKLLNNTLQLGLRLLSDVLVAPER